MTEAVIERISTRAAELANIERKLNSGVVTVKAPKKADYPSHGERQIPLTRARRTRLEFHRALLLAYLERQPIPDEVFLSVKDKLRAQVPYFMKFEGLAPVFKGSEDHIILTDYATRVRENPEAYRHDYPTIRVIDRPKSEVENY